MKLLNDNDVSEIQQRIRQLEIKVTKIESELSILKDYIQKIYDTNDKWFKIIVMLIIILGALIGVKVTLP